MRNRIRSWRRQGTAWLLASWPAVVLAQPAEVGDLPSEKPYLPWAIGVAILTAMLVVVFINPRRSPQ